MDIFTTCTSVIAVMNAVFRLKQQIRQVSALGDLRHKLAELSRVVTSVTETLENLDFGSPTSTQTYEHAVCHGDCANTVMNREKALPLLSNVRKLLEDCSATIDELQSRDRSRRHVRIAAKGYPRVVVVPLRDQNIYACLGHYTFRLKALKTALDSCVRDTTHATSDKKESSTAMLASKEKDRQMIDIVSWLRARTGTTLLPEDGRKQGKHGFDLTMFEHKGVMLVDTPGFDDTQETNADNTNGVPLHLAPLLAEYRPHPDDDDDVPGWYSTFHEPLLSPFANSQSSVTTEDQEAEDAENVARNDNSDRFIHDASFFLASVQHKMPDGFLPPDSQLGLPLNLEDSEQQWSKINFSSTSLGTAKSLASPGPWRDRQNGTYERNYQVLASLGIVSAGIATAMIIHLRHTFSVGLGEMDRGDVDPVRRVLGVQTTLVYTLSFVLYGVVGLTNLMRGQRYWSDCGLVTTLIAVFIGCIVGMETMLDTLIVGGYVSLITAKLLAYLNNFRSHNTALPSRLMAKTSCDVV